MINPNISHWERITISKSTYIFLKAVLSPKWHWKDNQRWICLKPQKTTYLSYPPWHGTLNAQGLQEVNKIKSNVKWAGWTKGCAWSRKHREWQTAYMMGLPLTVFDLQSWTQEFTATLIMKCINEIPPSSISINVNKVNPQLLISVFKIIIVLRICLNLKFLKP